LQLLLQIICNKNCAKYNQPFSKKIRANSLKKIEKKIFVKFQDFYFNSHFTMHMFTRIFLIFFQLASRSGKKTRLPNITRTPRNPVWYLRTSNAVPSKLFLRWVFSKIIIWFFSINVQLLQCNLHEFLISVNSALCLSENISNILDSL
jgi:hypothetical protein